MGELDSFTREAEGRSGMGASGRGRYHQAQPDRGSRQERGARRPEAEQRGDRPVLFPPPPLLVSDDPPPTREPALLAIFSDTVTGWILDYGYLGVFVLMLLESACVPIPSEVTMLFGGALASAGFAGAGLELDLVLVVLAGTAGNLVGSWLAYAGGAVGGRPLLERFGRYLLIRPHEVDRAHEWFERHGDAAVFFGRLLPVIRTFISLPAGIARMRLMKFTVYTVLGCLPFVFVIAWLGYRAGDNWERVEHALEPFSWLIAGVLALLGAAYVARRWRTVRAEYAALDTLRRQTVSDEDPVETP
jgi:membrane protein DedA with SNARE-associated domain